MKASIRSLSDSTSGLGLKSMPENYRCGADCEPSGVFNQTVYAADKALEDG